MKKGINKEIFNSVGVFASTLLVTAMATYIYSPVSGSHADGVTTKVTAGVSTVASITVDTEELGFNVVPTGDGAFSSGAVTATVQTNNEAGYSLYFSSVDNATNMVHEKSSISSVIASDFSGTVTSAAMAANKWGYSTDNSKYAKIPTASSPAKIKNIDHYPADNELSSKVYIGAKISNKIPSGNYTKSVFFSVVAN